MNLLPQHSQACGPASNAVDRIAVGPTRLVCLGLTPRECEVMQWLSEGKRDREIALILGLSSRTVEKHVYHILTKLGVETRTAAACHCRDFLGSSEAVGAPGTHRMLRAPRDGLPSNITNSSAQCVPRNAQNRTD